MARLARHRPQHPLVRGVEGALDFLKDKFFAITGLLIAYVLGQQIVNPQTRVIKVALGLFVVLLLMLAPAAFGLSFFLIVFPFPAYTSYGSTNTMLLFILSIFWLLRVSTGEFTVRGKTGFEAFILAMAITLCVSLYNAPDARWRTEGVITLFFYFSVFILFYLTTNLVNDVADLQRVTLAITVSALLVFLTVLVEVFLPGATLIPGWIGMTYTYGTYEGRRMGGVVGGHDVLADICVLIFPLLLFRLYRASTLPRRLFYVGVLVLDLFSLVATGNRGGLIGIVFCISYLIWISRGEFKIVRYTLVFIGLVSGFLFFDHYLSHSQGGASVIDRTLHTRVESGFVPETRTEVWEGGWAGFKKHIFLGNGPWFDTAVIPQTHNGFLWSLVCVGIIGTIPWVLLLLKMVRETRKRLRGNYEEGDYASGLLTVLHVQVVTFIILQLRTDYQRSPSYAYLMWFVFGLAVVVMRLLDAEKEHAPAE
jgi:hypothetical protein